MIVTVPDVNIAELARLSTNDIEKLWRQHLREKVPEHLPKSLLARLLAYRLQVEKQGGLSKSAVAYLKTIETQLRDGRPADTPYLEEQKIRPGCQLIREHAGVDHRVTVLEGGYEWNGMTFSSLSSVAKAITGTNWSGQRFFGLKGEKQTSSGITT